MVGNPWESTSHCLHCFCWLQPLFKANTLPLLKKKNKTTTKNPHQNPTNHAASDGNEKLQLYVFKCSCQDKFRQSRLKILHHDPSAQFSADLVPCAMSGVGCALLSHPPKPSAHANPGTAEFTNCGKTDGSTPQSSQQCHYGQVKCQPRWNI